MRIPGEARRRHGSCSIAGCTLSEGNFLLHTKCSDGGAHQILEMGLTLGIL
jgi:hypothetical protein